MSKFAINKKNFFARNNPWLFLIILLAGFFATSSVAIDLSNNDLVLVQNNGSEGITLSIQTPELKLLPVQIIGNNYLQIENFTEGVAGEAGLFSVPSFSRWIEVPAGMRPVMRFTTGKERIINDVEIEPFPLLSDDNPNIDLPSGHTVEIQARNAFFPSAAVSLSELMTVGTKSMALVDIFPYQYNAVTKQLRIYADIEIKVSFQVDFNRKDDISRRSAPVYRELDRVLSGNPPERDDFAASQANLGHYVMIARNEEVIEILEPLIEWKRKKGFIVTVANMEDIGNRKEQIKAYLQDAWEEWEIPPNFVLLAGDQDGELIVPCYTAQANISWHASDNQYVNWQDGGDFGEWIPEGFIGRLPAAENRHLEHMVAKIVGYESDPYIEEPWVEGGVMIANGVQSCIASNIAVREMMVNYGYNRNRITEEYADYHQGQRPNINLIQTGINNGVGFINFRGYNNWGDFLPNHINGLRNGWKLPIVGGMVCGTNDFRNFFVDQRPECRGETFLRAWSANSPKGGVACYGPADLYTHTWFNNIVDAEFFNVMLNNDVRTLGVMCLAAKMALLRNLPSFRGSPGENPGDGHTVGYYFYTYNLLGDPGMQVWTRDPASIELEFESEIPVGSTLINAAISLEDEERTLPPVYVHIYAQSDDGEIRYGGYTDQNGEITLIVDPLPAGDYYLTVTGDNIVPILESFSVSEASIYTSIAEVTYSDDNEGESQGNDDGDFNPGETIEITITLTNTGAQDSDEFSGILSTTSPWVSIDREEVDWDGIDAGESAASEQPFVISLAHETPHSVKLSFVLSTIHGDLEMLGGFQPKVYGYDFLLSDIHFIGEDVELAPGNEESLLITLTNNGTFDSEPIYAVLHCNNPKIQIRSAESFLGEIAAGEDAYNDRAPFLIYAANDLYSYSTIFFGLLITDEEGRRDSLEFEFTAGGNMEIAPQGPTDYGYWAFDSRDTTENMNPEYNWIDGEDDLNLTDFNDAPQPSGVGGSNRRVDLPFEFIYFGEQFSEITVGSNGWLCFGRTAHVGWNNQEIGTGLGPPSMLCPYWTDLWSGDVLTFFDEDNDRFIIEWRDVRDYDGSHTFAVHLYKRDARLTKTGDCEFEFLYEDYGRNLGPGRDLEQEDVTIGFGSPNRQDQMTIAHAGNWNPRTMDLEDGMTVRFTTGILTEIGGVQGTVTAVEDESPMENVRVMLDGTGFFGNTDGDGHFLIEGAPIGNYSVVAQKRYYNIAVQTDVQIVDDETAEVDLQMTYPTFNIDTEEIRIAVDPGESDSTGFEIWNEGNGPLDYSFNINYNVEQPDERDAAWDPLFDLAAGDSVNDARLNGVAFEGDHFYVSGTVTRRQLPHKIYKFDRMGNFVSDFDQHTIDSSVTLGYAGMEIKDGNLLSAESDKFIELTLEGELVEIYDTYYERTSILAWSPERGTIFSRNTIGAMGVVETDLDGNLVNNYPVDDNFRTYGMTWFPADEDGFNVYIFGNFQDPVEESNLLLFKMNPESGEYRMVRALHVDNMDLSLGPKGCTITKAYNPLLWTFVALVSGSPYERIVGWELEPNLTWISYEPESGQVPAGESQLFKLNFYTEGMPEREYRIILELYHNAVGDMQEIPIFFTVGEVSVKDDDQPMVEGFKLEGVFPNPFNPSTTISYILPESADVTIGIYSVDGRLVEHFDLGRLVAGAQYYHLDGTEMASGIYLVRVRANAHTATQKLVLMR